MPDARVGWRLLATALLCACATTVDARRVELRILHTTDIHANILPSTDYEGVTNVGGMLRCAKMIGDLRAEQPNTLLVDCGDLFQGTPEGYLTGGRIMKTVIEYLDYDAWSLGNHEFDWGLSKLIPLVESTTVPVLAANIRATPGSASPFTKIRPFVIREVDGVRVAIVGLITPGVPSWSLPDQLGTLEFRKSVETLRETLGAVREQDPDLVVVTAHQGYREGRDDHANEINAIAKEFPDLDVILGGHSHKVVEHVELGNVLYSQAGYHAIWLGCVDIAYDTVARRTISKEARVFRIDASIPDDARLADMLAGDIATAREYRSAVVGESADEIPSELDARGESPIQQLIVRAIDAGVDADVILHGRLSDDALHPGPVTRDDIWRVVPYENRIGILSLTPGELAEILAENEQRRGTISEMGCEGVHYDVVKDAAGQIRIERIRLPDGTPVHPRKRLRVAVNSYVLASGGTRFQSVRRLHAKPECAAEVLPVDTRTLVEGYVKTHSPLRLADLQPPKR